MTTEQKGAIEIGAFVIGFACVRMCIEYKRCGKRIVAIASDQKNKQRQFLDEVRSNSVADVRMITREEAVALKPQLSCLSLAEHICALLDLTPCVAQ